MIIIKVKQVNQINVKDNVKKDVLSSLSPKCKQIVKDLLKKRHNLYKNLSKK